MPRISAIVFDRRVPTRCTIKLDDGEEIASTIDVITALTLRKDVEVGPILARVTSESARGRLYERAINLIAGRNYSSVELQRKLRMPARTKHPAPRAAPPEDEVVDSVIQALLAKGLLDDTAYARNAVRLLLRRKWGQMRIAYHLVSRGIDRTTAHRVVAEVSEAENVDVAANIASVAEKKLRSLSKLDAQTQRRRLYGFLLRQGFSSDAIRPVLQRVLGRAVDVDDVGDLSDEAE